MIPRFTLPRRGRGRCRATPGTHARRGDLTRYLSDMVGRDFPVDDWLHGVARVRDKMRHWENAIMLAEAFGADPPVADADAAAVRGRRLVAGAGDPAAGAAGSAPSSATACSTRRTSPAPSTRRSRSPACWSTSGPRSSPKRRRPPASRSTTTGPNSEPPQCWLLALPAVMDGAWQWDELRDAVTSTLDAARRRAIEPDHIAGTDYGWLLPATYAAYTFPEISISNYLLRNVDVFARVEGVTVDAPSLADVIVTNIAARRSSRGATRRSRAGTGWRAGRARHHFDRALRAEVRDSALDAHQAVAARRVPGRRRRLAGAGAHLHEHDALRPVSGRTAARSSR